MILASGEQYDKSSVEFRLAILQINRESEIEKINTLLFSNLLTGIFFAGALGRVSDESRDANISQAKELQKLALKALSLAGSNEQEEREKRKQEENRIVNQHAYAAALAKTGSFNSLEQLQAAITALNETIINSKLSE